MLTIVVPKSEQFDAATNEFISVEETTLQLEHSLLSISKWESKWQIPFLSADNKTIEQILDYIRCMTINKNVDPNVYRCLTNDNIEEVNKYISSPMTATWISEVQEEGQGVHKKQIITSELIYYWMIALQIPVEFEKWHLNRLLMLIRVCQIKNEPPKKRGRNELLTRNLALNEQRLKQMAKKG